MLNFQVEARDYFFAVLFSKSLTHSKMDFCSAKNTPDVFFWGRRGGGGMGVVVENSGATFYTGAVRFTPRRRRNPDNGNKQLLKPFCLLIYSLI